MTDITLQTKRLSDKEHAQWLAEVVDMVDLQESQLVGSREWMATSNRGLAPEEAVAMWGLSRLPEIAAEIL